MDDSPSRLSSRVARTQVLRSENGDTRYEEDRVAIEEPLEIAVSLRGQLHSMGVAFRTPGEDQALALGMLVSEGIVRGRSDVLGVDLKREEDATLPATRITVTLADHVAFDMERYRRVFPISSACGACGKSALEALRIERVGPFHPSEGIRLGQSSLLSLPDRLLQRQADFQHTGALHAAACFDAEGEILHVAEDIGRHNALDKLIGQRLLSGEKNCHEAGLLFSGRVGYDLMQKSLQSGCAFLASIGAPSSFAVELANVYKMTLVGFLRDGRFNVYSGPHRIQIS
ncbi:formate dehydrogenase accessory sulfurtransferase FdhD [Pelagicoccus sp. SDUM812003]|uniref:formate dehydrogenase accessory sulfurtransferase FdhD n=1 Tax=Pelagicoccus sp. SDUM812003 TaxID=3041267 RepID=UPI00280CE53D|nr:formate dehydrogenase accessory sulfurtransferase FdhD [Pelagicoccus sp. SDUM812003]MDQ8201915.1 formate dehydrogenase accessory sulfurtransferase FdhD [Pelagicoccus sp. SDUM812003]